MSASSDDADADAAPGPGTPGTYRATFVLGVPGMSSVKGNVNFDELEVEIEVGIDGTRRLQYVRLEVTADSFDDAHRQAYELVMPTLSRWSFVHNVGISVSSIELREVSTGVRQFHFTVVGQDRTFADMAGA
jgi:hypothetical protein